MAKFAQIGTSGFIEEANPIVTSSGVANANQIPQTNSSGYLDITLLPPGIGTDTVAVTAGENISSGALVYIDSTGKAFNADATSPTKFAVGFVLAGASSAASVTVYFIGQNTSLSGLTAGTSYFLSASSIGAITATPPTTAGYISQFVGKALSTTTLNFNPLSPVKRA